jgi:hypothetical protein
VIKPIWYDRFSRPSTRDQVREFEKNASTTRGSSPNRFGLVSEQPGFAPDGVSPNSYDQTCNANNVPSGIYPGITGKGMLMWFNPNCFVAATPGTKGNEHPNQFYGPGLDRLDFSIFKTFSLTERYKLQFRVEAFNLSNTPMFNTPNTSSTFLSSTVNASNAAPPVEINTTHLPGEIQGMNANWNQRELQLALKLNF